MKYISFFKDTSARDVEMFGGKAASLKKMVGVGFPVPNGFAVSVEAFKDFKGKKFNDEFKRELLSAYKEIGGGRVAVRSSAVAEDASSASWAGQLETYLNVSEKNILSSIRKCWASMQSKEALAYAKNKKLTEKDLAVGVVVQGMIESEVSGVMFTINPVTNNRRQMVIEGVYGLGEMIVQGIVTPDSWLVTKKPFVVEEFNISIKKKEMVFYSGRNRTRLVSKSRNDRATLREEQVLKLARIGLKLEKYYGCPQDIEWAWAKGEFFIVQSRPITTLK